MSYGPEYLKGFQLRQAAASTSPQEHDSDSVATVTDSTTKRALAQRPGPVSPALLGVPFSYGEQVHCGKHILSLAVSVHLPSERIFFFFHSSVLHLSLLQALGTPHAGSPTNYCAPSPEMMRALMAFQTSLESEHCQLLLPC